MGDMTEFGAVQFDTEPPYYRATFHGRDPFRQTFIDFAEWLRDVTDGRSPKFVSDNPAYDWQWINFYFHLHLGRNPFGFSARRIGDFYAGLVGDFRRSNEWKRLRITPHDHNPVHDAIGNAEALGRMLKGERA
jgi:hypothetical protein